LFSIIRGGGAFKPAGDRLFGAITARDNGNFQPGEKIGGKQRREGGKQKI